MPGKLQKMWVATCGHEHHTMNRDLSEPEGSPDYTTKASEQKQREVFAALEKDGWEIDPKEGLICPTCATKCEERACKRTDHVLTDEKHVATCAACQGVASGPKG